MFIPPEVRHRRGYQVHGHRFVGSTQYEGDKVISEKEHANDNALQPVFNARSAIA